MDITWGFPTIDFDVTTTINSYSQVPACGYTLAVRPLLKYVDDPARPNYFSLPQYEVFQNNLVPT